MIKNVAIIPDGNRRWAKLHGLPALEGHRRGAEAMDNVIDYLVGHKLEHLTFWGFSTDNWKRSQDEISDIFQLVAQWIEKDTPWLHSRGVRLCHIGRLWELPDYLQQTIIRAAELTKNNTGMTLNLAFNYTGRAEVIDAVRRLIDGGGPSGLVDEELFSRYLYTNGMPDVDLVIRTAGEVRLSNFLLWQTAYSEYYFTQVLWPNFDTKELKKALQNYSERQRRFGGN